MTSIVDMDGLGRSIEGLVPQLADVYEDLHAHPELSFAEHRTAGIAADALDRLGFDVTTGVGGTGVVATLGDDEGPTVLLRADMDALPVEEATGLPYASSVRAIDPDGVEVPVAHACGHDMHVAWLLGVAELLAGNRSAWRGRAMLVLQPAEEVGGGAAAMCDDGLFERFGTPVVGLGQHVVPGPAGWVLLRSGMTMAASDSLKVVLHGRGGHGSMPETTIDPVVMAASTIMRLQGVVSREIGATESAVLTVGTVHAGNKSNVIPDRAELGLNVRTFDPRVRTRVLSAIGRIVHGESAAAGASAPPDIEPVNSFPAVTNDATTTETVEKALAEHLSAGRVVQSPMVPGSEDFGIFGERGGFPSTFWFVGGADHTTFFEALANDRVRDDIPSNHSPLFAPVQDPTIAAGVEAMYVAARQWLS